MTASVAGRLGRRHQLLRAVLVVAGLALAPAAQAQQQPPVGEDPAFDARARAVAEQLRCPVCLGNSIQDSPSQLAQDMRHLVREQLAAGKSETEIKAFFVDRYGEWVLLAPKATGFNLVVWVLPLVMLVGGGIAVWLAVRKWAAAGGHGRPEAAEDEYLRRVREEVARGRS